MIKDNWSRQAKDRWAVEPSVIHEDNHLLVVNKSAVKSSIVN